MIETLQLVAILAATLFAGAVAGIASAWLSKDLGWLVAWGRVHAIRTALSVLAPLVLLSATPVPSSGAAPHATPSDEVAFRQLMQRLADGWNEGDARRAADCFTEDAVYTEPPDKQEYRGRQKLYEFFGGDLGRKASMHMVWHHLAFNASTQVGLGEFTFEYGSKAHGVVVVKLRDGRIAHWREYYYESALSWEEFIRRNPF
jgi:ketosteroid isomerase-like protein